MTDKPGIGDFDVKITLGDRPVTLKYSIRNSLALTEGVGLRGLGSAIATKDLGGIARIIQIASGGKYDDHGVDEPLLTTESVIEGMYQTGVYELANGPLDDYVWFVMFAKPKGAVEPEVKKKKAGPQPEA